MVPGVDEPASNRLACLVVDVADVGKPASGGRLSDVVLMKSVAGRPQDQEDIARLKEARGEI